MDRTKRMLPVSQIRAAISDNSLNEENRTVELVWTTGSKGLRSSWGERYYEELSLDPSHVDLTRLADGAPVLAAHDDSSLDSVIGVVERASVDGKIGTATVRFAKDEYSQRIFEKVKDKILRNVSVGYSVSEYTDVSAPGDEIPTYRATRWMPAELSIVPIGFDAGAKTRNQENVTENEVEIIKTRSEDNINKETEMSEKNQPTVDTEALKKEAAQAERARATEIRKLVRSMDLSDTLAEDMIERGLPIEEAKRNAEAFKKAIEASKKTDEVTPTVRNVEVGGENQEKRREALESALLARVDSSFKMSEDAKPLFGKSVLRQLETVIPRHTMESDASYAKRAMQSSDLPLTLANVAEKSLQKQYQTAPSTFEAWTSKGTLRNYKQASQVKAGDFANLQTRAENADFATATIGEANEVVTLQDHGIIHAFSSQMLVNDDLGVLKSLASRGGAAVKRYENKLAYAALLANKTMADGIACFHASHGNLGSAGAISQTTVGEALKLMRKQKTTDGLDYLNLSPKYLVVGPELEVAARMFVASIIPNQTSSVNIFQNSMEVIVDPQITNDDYYFIADPSIIDTVTCYHLEGQEAPTIESRIKWENNSLELKVAHAFAASAMDWRGMVKNKGTDGV